MNIVAFYSMYHQVGFKTGLPRGLANLILSHLETPLNKLRTADTHPGEAHRVFVFASHCGLKPRQRSKASLGPMASMNSS